MLDKDRIAEIALTLEQADAAQDRLIIPDSLRGTRTLSEREQSEIKSVSPDGTERNCFERRFDAMDSLERMLTTESDWTFFRAHYPKAAEIYDRQNKVSMQLLRLFRGKKKD